MQVVVNGAGAAAVSCAKLYMALGVRPENLVMCDSKGVITTRRTNLSAAKAQFATDRDIATLAEALRGADVFLGLSVADVLTQEMVRSMAADPIVFALANPNPEISYDNAMAAREDIIFATAVPTIRTRSTTCSDSPISSGGLWTCGRRRSTRR